MSLISEFRKFSLRGNMLDLALGFTVGAAFTTIVQLPPKPGDQVSFW